MTWNSSNSLNPSKGKVNPDCKRPLLICSLLYDVNHGGSKLIFQNRKVSMLACLKFNFPFHRNFQQLRQSLGRILKKRDKTKDAIGTGLTETTRRTVFGLIVEARDTWSNEIRITTLQ